jgi:hypothetical protein
MNIKGETINSILKGLNISNERYIYIISYIQQMIKDYKGQPIDMIKEIPLNLKGNERYFSIFYIGNSFSSLFSEMDDKEKTDFVVNISKALKLSDERVSTTADYMSDTIKIQMKENIPTLEIIKGIINSTFTDVEKDYIMFVFGMVLV